MTAIFLVWNPSGLALAADKSISITRTNPDGNEEVLFNDYLTKIYKPERFNFAVGAAGNLKINNIPILSILEQWGKTADPKPYLLDHVEDFLIWYATESMLENANDSSNTTLKYVQGCLGLLKNYLDIVNMSESEINETINLTFDDWEKYNQPNIFGFSEKKTTTDYRYNESTDSDEHLCVDFCSRFAKFNLNENDHDYLVDSLSNLIILCFAEYFEKSFDLEIEWHANLLNRMTNFLMNYVSGNFKSTDIMFVGYGNDDWVPHIVTLSLYNFDQLLPWAVIKKVSNANHIWYFALGQYETFDKFLDPISSDVRREIYDELRSKFGEEAFFDNVLTEIDRIIVQHEDDILEPIRNKINLLSVDKLAYLAQQMVSLESLSSFIREYLPTVGGEIDVVKLTRVDSAAMQFSSK
jgi:hypothetical protein